MDLPKVRPPVLTSSSIQRLDEYLRFRHVVRNVYTFSFDPERVGRLVNELDVVFNQIRQELLVFANFLEKWSEAMIQETIFVLPTAYGLSLVSRRD